MGLVWKQAPFRFLDKKPSEVALRSSPSTVVSEFRFHRSYAILCTFDAPLDHLSSTWLFGPPKHSSFSDKLTSNWLQLVRTCFQTVFGGANRLDGWMHDCKETHAHGNLQNRAVGTGKPTTCIPWLDCVVFFKEHVEAYPRAARYSIWCYKYDS